jgi:putative transposase
MTEEECEAWALYRYRVISPLLDPATDRPPWCTYLTQLQATPITAPTGQSQPPSARTIRRWIHQYRAGGFAALRPQPRADLGKLRAFPPALWDQAVAFKREVPERSAEQVLALLRAWAPTAGISVAAIATMRRSTLYRHWHQAGWTRKRIRTTAPKRYRRWEAAGPGDLWQSDVMNGPFLPDPTPDEPDRRRATYCLVLLDDYSRRIVAGQFAWHADTTLLEGLLWQAVQRWGVPQRLYTDNGAIYVSHRLEGILARLDVRLRHTPPYEPAGKGKQERLWGSIQASFLPELRVRPATSLGELNTWFTAWSEEHYHARVHRETGETPFARWQAGNMHRSVTWEALHAAFLERGHRTVDKTGQIAWQGRKWIVPEGLLQCRVELRWDPHAPETVTVWYENQCYGQAVAADAPGGSAAPRAATPDPAVWVGPGLSYLEILAEQRTARHAGGIAWAATPSLSKEE